MDGMETLRLIMRRAPLPVIMVSTHSKEGAYATFKALALGAIDFVAKPKEASSGHLDAIATQLIEKIKVAKRAVGSRIGTPAIAEPIQPVKKMRVSRCPSSHHRYWRFHGRTKRAPIRSFANSRGVYRKLADRPTYARRFYGNVCSPAG